MLVYVRTPERLPAALMAFKTLRVGFPTADVLVSLNPMTSECREAVRHEAARCGCRLYEYPSHIAHDAWLDKMLDLHAQPFWTVDTDVHWFQSVETWFTGPEAAATNFAGRYEPVFEEEYTRTTRVERLHPCMAWWNPVRIRDEIRRWRSLHPCDPCIPQLDLTLQRYVPMGRKVWFYDTAAGLYHALGGTRFTAVQDEAFAHLGCGTYIDLIQPHLKDAPHLALAHELVHSGQMDVEILQDLHRRERAYHARRAPKD